MIHGLAIPYELHSYFGVEGMAASEVISRGAFKRAVESGRSSSGKLIFACWGHERGSRKKWRIADTQSGLLLEDRSDGVWFTLDAQLPMTFTGVSVLLIPRRWEKRGHVWRLLEGDIKHVALLEAPQHPAYERTFLDTIRATMSLPRSR